MTDQTKQAQVTEPKKARQTYGSLTKLALKVQQRTAAATAFLADLHAQFDVTEVRHSYGRDSKRSMAITWIRAHRELFVEVTTPEERLAFFHAHLESPYISEVASDSNLIGLLDKEDRVGFIAEVASVRVMPRLTWITRAEQAGFNSHAIAEMVLDRVKNRGFSARETAPFVRNFVVRGATTGWQTSTDEEGLGANWTPSPWSAWSLMGKRLEEILTLCAERVPELFFAEPKAGQPSIFDALTAHGDQVNSSTVLSAAARSLTSLKGASLSVLRELSFEDRLALARRFLPDSLEFLVDVLFDDDYLAMVESGGQAIDFSGNWGQCAPQDRQEFLSVFRQMHGLLRHLVAESSYTHFYKCGATPASVILETLKEQLSCHGFIIAQMRAPGSNDKGRQPYVEVREGSNVIRYLNDRRGSYTLGVGEYAIVDPRHKAHRSIRTPASMPGVAVFITPMVPATAS